MKIVWILDSNLKPWYSEWLKEIRKYRNDFFLKKWIKLVVVNINYLNIDLWVFTRYKSQEWLFDIVYEEIMPEIIWARTTKDYIWYLTVLEWKTKIFPSNLVIKLASDKRSTYRYLKEYQPRTILLSEALDDISVLDDMWEKYVLKPRNWFWGDWITMISKDDLYELTDNLNSTEYVLQEVCDFSWWYEGIASWNHDLRLVYIWWKLSYSEIRTNDNDFRVNVSQWWVATFVDISEIPNALKKIANSCVMKLWWSASWVVWIDFWYDCNESRWVLIEINYSPWFISEELHSNRDSIDLAFNQYANYFNSIM